MTSSSPSDLAARVDACRLSAAGGRVERSDGSVGSAHKAVSYEVRRVKEVSCDLAARIYA